MRKQTITQPTTFRRFAIIKDEKSNGTSGGSNSSSSWNQRTLNAMSVYGSGSGWISLSSSNFTLQPGRYFIQATAPSYRTNANKLAIYNNTDASRALIGTNCYCGASDAENVTASVFGVVEITAAKSFKLEHWTAAVNGGAQGLGIATSASVTEVYAQVMVEQLEAF